MKTLIITHRDADGISSAISFAINQIKNDNLENNFENILSNFDILDIQYGENLFEKLKNKNYILNSYAKIVLLDFSLDLDTMKDLNKKLKDNFIWIDHHKRKYEEVEKVIDNINGLRDYKHCAAVLVWKYFNREIPEFIKYIENLDLWNFNMPDAKFFIAGLISLKTHFTNYEYKYVYDLIDEKVFSNKKIEIINRGKIIKDYEQNYIKSLCNTGKTVLFEGYKTFLINSSFHASVISEYIFNSDKFKDVDVVFVWQKVYYKDKTLNKCSLRSRKHIDISVIAKKYGGNGHPQASGFVINNIEDVEFEEI